MAVLIECVCRKKQSIKNKTCSLCGRDLDKLKKSPNSRFWINYRVEGRQRTEYIGSSLSEAKDALGTRRGQVRKHEFFQVLPEVKMTVKQLGEWYLGLTSTQSLRSYGTIERVLKVSMDYFGGRTLENIKPVDLEEFIAKQIKDGKKPATIEQRFDVLKMAVNKAFQNDMISARTLKAFRTVKVPFRAGSNARTRTWTLEEWIKLMDVAPHYLKVAMVLALYCGMRRQEMTGLTWDEVSLKDGFIKLSEARTKEKRSKKIPLAPAVKKILAETPRGLHVDHVLLNNGKPVFTGTFTNALKFACKKAGIPYGMKDEDGLRLHDLRANFKKGAALCGIDEALRNALVGHSQRGMDRYYMRFTDEDLKAAMMKYTTWLEAQLSSAYSSAYPGVKAAI